MSKTFLFSKAAKVMLVSIVWCQTYKLLQSGNKKAPKLNQHLPKDPKPEFVYVMRFSQCTNCAATAADTHVATLWCYTFNTLCIKRLSFVLLLPAILLSLHSFSFVLFILSFSATLPPSGRQWSRKYQRIKQPTGEDLLFICLSGIAINLAVIVCTLIQTFLIRPWFFYTNNAFEYCQNINIYN